VAIEKTTINAQVDNPKIEIIEIVSGIFIRFFYQNSIKSEKTLTGLK